MTRIFPQSFKNMWSRGYVKLTLVSDIQPTNPYDCQNCGGVGSKIDLSNIFEASDPGDLMSLIFLVFGMNAEFLAVLAISVTVMTFVLLKFAPIHGATKIFVFFFSLLILILTGLSRFTDLTPSTFEIFLYFLYHLGITIGILAGSARKIKSKKLDWR